jgi:hypothetical protein
MSISLALTISVNDLLVGVISWETQLLFYGSIMHWVFAM